MQIRCDEKPMCDACPEFVLEVTTDTVFASGCVAGRVTTVRCANRRLCDNIERHVKQQLDPASDVETYTNLFNKGAFS